MCYAQRQQGPPGESVLTTQEPAPESASWYSYFQHAQAGRGLPSSQDLSHTIVLVQVCVNLSRDHWTKLLQGENLTASCFGSQYLQKCLLSE